MNILKKRSASLIGAMVVLSIGALFLFIRRSSNIQFLKAPDVNLKKVYGTENVVPFLVLGSGPASLAAALYGARTRVRTVVLKGNQPGGQLTGTSYIENWPAIRKIRGVEVVKDFEEQAASFGAVMVSDSAKSVDLSSWPYKVVTEEGKELSALSLFIGTGATPKKLGVPGESEYWGNGVTTCAICDAPYHKGDTVIVIGGGDSAVEEALELSAYASEVRMLVRKDVLKASPTMSEHLAKCSNVKVVFNTSLLKINGLDGHVDSVDVINSETKKTEHWPEVKGVFLAIGHQPNTWLFKDQIKISSTGYIKLQGRRQLTSKPGVFAAGDVADYRYKQAGVAAGDGIKAGLDAMWWLSEIGYNTDIEEKLETSFFDPQLDNKFEITQVKSVGELNEIFKEVKNKLIILDFYTPFCPSCMHMMPVIQWVGTKLAKKVLFLKVDASIAFDLVKKYQVPQVPHFIVFKHGEIIDRSNEVLDREGLYSFAKSYLK